MPGMSIKKSLAWMGGTSILGQVITWSATIIVARLLTPEDYGLVALAGLFTVFAQSVSEMGVGAAVIQRKEITQSQIRALYGFSILVGVGMTLLGLLAGPAMAFIFSDNRLIPLVAFQSLVFIFAAAKSMQRNILVRETRFDAIGKVETISRIATSACTLVLAASDFGYWAIAAQGVLVEFFQFGLFFRIKQIRPSLRIRFSEIKGVLGFGAKLMVRNIVARLYAMVDTAIIGKLASKDFLGAYGFSKKLTNMPFEKVIRLINQVLFPYLSQRQTDLTAVRDLTLKVADFQALIITPFFYLLFFSAEETVHILLGSHWSAAVFPLKIFCIANVFKLAESYNMNCLTALGKISEQIKYMILLFAAITIGMLSLGMTVDAQASILVWVSVYPVLSLFFSRILLKEIGIGFRDVFRRLRSILLGHLFMLLTLGGLSFVALEPAWLSLIVKCLAGICVYGVSMVLMDYAKVKVMILEFIPKLRKAS